MVSVDNFDDVLYDFCHNNVAEIGRSSEWQEEDKTPGTSDDGHDFNYDGLIRNASLLLFGYTCNLTLKEFLSTSV